MCDRSAKRIHDDAVSVSNLTKCLQFVMWNVSFLCKLRAGKAVLRDTFGGWIERSRG